MNRTWFHVVHADMNEWECKAVYITSPYSGVSPVKISQYMDICPIFLSEGLVYEFCDCGPRFHQPSASAWPLRTNWGIEVAFCQEVSWQEGRYQVRENEPSTTTGLINYAWCVMVGSSGDAMGRRGEEEVRALFSLWGVANGLANLCDSVACASRPLLVKQNL